MLTFNLVTTLASFFISTCCFIHHLNLWVSFIETYFIWIARFVRNLYLVWFKFFLNWIFLWFTESLVYLFFCEKRFAAKNLTNSIKLYHLLNYEVFVKWYSTRLLNCKMYQRAFGAFHSDWLMASKCHAKYMSGIHKFRKFKISIIRMR